MSGEGRVIFWIAILSALLVASYVMFLAFNPRIGNPIVTMLVIFIIYVVGFVGAYYRFKRRNW